MVGHAAARSGDDNRNQNADNDFPDSPPKKTS